jgi:hypothetical protein
MIRPKPIRATLALVAVLAFAGILHASGAGFNLSAIGLDLGKADETGEVIRYKVKLEVGKTATLVAQGIVMPRGAPASPGEAEKAVWQFDEAAFQVVPHDKDKFDKTKTVVALKALKAGATRVRFAGTILGREQKYEIAVEIVEGKK